MMRSVRIRRLALPFSHSERRVNETKKNLPGLREISKLAAEFSFNEHFGRCPYLSASNPRVQSYVFGEALTRPLHIPDGAFCSFERNSSNQIRYFETERRIKAGDSESITIKLFERDIPLAASLDFATMKPILSS